MAENRPAAILTEVGTNELEVVEFLLGDGSYVINVAKVREIIRPQRVMKVPGADARVLGVFRNRETVVPLVDLGRWLGVTAPADDPRARIIVAEFNGMRVGLLVHGVRRIHRLSWSDLESLEGHGGWESRTSLGCIRLREDGESGERIVFLLDFERIVAELGGATADGVADCRVVARGERQGRGVLVVDDSSLIRKTLMRTLQECGYRVVAASNGEEAWAYVQQGHALDAVVTDIEMPRMDGHRLLKLIKGEERFAGLQVILYSSMIHEEMRRKGESLGADAQVCKPDLPGVLEALDRLLLDPAGPQHAWASRPPAAVPSG